MHDRIRNATKYSARTPEIDARYENNDDHACRGRYFHRRSAPYYSFESVSRPVTQIRRKQILFLVEFVFFLFVKKLFCGKSKSIDARRSFLMMQPRFVFYFTSTTIFLTVAFLSWRMNHCRTALMIVSRNLKTKHNILEQVSSRCLNGFRIVMGTLNLKWETIYAFECKSHLSDCFFVELYHCNSIMICFLIPFLSYGETISYSRISFRLKSP